MIPGYAEAVREERRRRNRSEFALPDTVCGVTVRPLTLADITVLQEAGVCFFDESPDAYDAATSLVMLLWWQWTRRPAKAKDRLKRRFARAVGYVSTERAQKELDEWLYWQFADAPPRKEGTGGTSPPIASFAVSMCDAVASHCAFSRAEIMALPLPVLWQHVKLAQVARAPDTPRFNPSDRVKTEFLRNRMKSAS